MTLILVGMIGMANIGDLLATNLRCQALSEPVGIGLSEPKVSWELKAVEPSGRNLRQSAFQIIVEEVLGGKPVKIYDSKRVASDESHGIKLPIKLRTSTAYRWKVRIWDQNGDASGWSKAAKFATTDISGNAKASWISAIPTETNPVQLEGASWIWSQDSKATDVRFSRIFPATAGQAGSLCISADNEFVAKLNGVEIARSDGNEDAWRRPSVVPVKLQSSNHLEILAKNAANSPAGMIARLDFGSTKLSTDETWTADNAKAKVIGPYGSQPWGQISGRLFRAAYHYRKPFTLRKAPVTRASVTYSALGLVDLYLNGKRLTDDLFTPGWTDYDKRIYTRTIEVGNELKAGENVLGAILGDGWYSGYVGYGSRRGLYGDKPSLIAQLVIQYADGTQEVVGTDTTWRCAAGGTTRQDFLAGESFDARREPRGWSSPGFDAKNWAKPEGITGIKGKLESFPSQPVRVYQELKPVSIKKTATGSYIFNFGQNLAGFARLRVSEPVGTKIEMQFVEVLNPDGTIYKANLRAAEAKDIYISGTGKNETWTPRFTFHGFQYVEISGLTKPPTKDTLTALAMSTDTPEVGTIETSDKMINQLASNAWWTQKMNFIDIPTDCPQRDERLGWTGDAQAYIRTASYFSDVEAFFNKWNTSLDDAQRSDGQFPMVAPLKVAEGDGGPAWADAGVICPWTTYEFYGDKDRLAEHYPNMKKFVDFCVGRSTAELLPPSNYHCFGDWLSINANTPNDVIYTAYFAGSAQIVADAAAVLGKKADAKTYGDLAKRVRAAFSKAYTRPDGWVQGDTQCGYVLALAFDILPPDVAKRAAERLVANIKERGWHLSTGFVGTRDLMHVLSKIGRDDVAFRLLHNKTFPSWGFEIENGATTVWERWDGWTPEKGFQDAGMNSFAHYAYGAVMGWVFENIGGIKALEPSFNKIAISPKIDPNLTHSNVRYRSVRGDIVSNWRIEGGKLWVKVTVPANCTAVFTMPHQGGPIQSETKGKNNVFDLGSGTYEFSTRWQRANIQE